MLALTLSAPSSALAQGTVNAERVPATGAESPAAVESGAAESSVVAQPSTSATTTTPAPAPAPTPPVVVAPPVPAVPAQGQWVYTETYGWIWVPQGATSVLVQEQPYVYLYSPVYGWTWYGSPWGPGAYYVGPWVHHGWGAARVWHRGGWYAPHVVVRTRGPVPVYRGGGGGHSGHRSGHR